MNQGKLDVVRQEMVRINLEILGISKNLWEWVKGKPFNITVIQVYAPTTDAKQAEVGQFYEDLEDLLELTSNRMFYSSSGIWLQASLALENKMKRGKG